MGVEIERRAFGREGGSRGMWGTWRGKGIASAAGACKTAGTEWLAQPR